MKIAKIYDQPGWAYWWIAQEMSRYSRHTITPQVYNKVDYENLDVCLISSPNISYSLSAVQIPLECKKRGIKVIGQYSGEVDMQYQYADLIVAISPQLYWYAKSKYPNTPVIFLPESIDTDFFVPKVNAGDSFQVGWAGGKNKPIKRAYLLEKLKYPVKIQSNHGKQFFTPTASLEPMRNFYQSIDCFVLTSTTECMPRVIMEAMSSGLPVVSTDVGAVPLLLSPEWIVPVFPDEAVIEKMNNRLDCLKEDTKFKKWTGYMNREYILKNFSWAVNQPVWDDVFEALKANNFDKINSINDYFLKKFEMQFVLTEKYKEQISRFEQQSKMNHLKNVKTGNALTDFILALNASDIVYAVGSQTCLDVVLNSETKSNKLFIETNSLHYLQLKDFIETTKGQYKNIEVVLTENPRLRKVKIMTMNNVPVYVPYPVTHYLNVKFGKQWKRDYNDLHPESPISL